MQAPKNLKDILLLISVFVTGGTVLIIEILAMRILSPYYGNTIYTSSSVITTVLAALSLGYYLGGRLSDKYPYHKLFYCTIFVSGILVMFIRFLDVAMLPLLGQMFSLESGPLISSLTIFFVPAFCLGTLSPFAIKLHKKEDLMAVDRVGSQSGEVFFWSTIGSIAGSFLSGFVLIPSFGINAIIVGAGTFLALWGFCGFLFFSPKRLHICIMILVFGYMLILPWLQRPVSKTGTVYQKDGVYERITISDGAWNGLATRFLFQDRSYSAAMFLNSDDLVYDYTKYYKLYTLFNANPKAVFIIGGGAYSIPKAFLKSSAANVEVTEIEPELLTLAKTYFNFQDNARFQNYTEDGRRFLSQHDKKYDVIVSDVYYSLFSIPMHFTTKEFFDTAKSRLAPGGVLIGNFGGNLQGEAAPFVLSEMKTFKESFPNSYFFAVVSPDYPKAQNIIFLGINGAKKLDFGSNDIASSPDPVIKSLGQKNIDIAKLDFSKSQILTDNFAPVEYLVGKVITAWH